MEWKGRIIVPYHEYEIRCISTHIKVRGCLSRRWRKSRILEQVGMEHLFMRIPSDSCCSDHYGAERCQHEKHQCYLGICHMYYSMNEAGYYCDPVGRL